MKKTNMTLLWALGFALLAGGAQAQSSGAETEGTGMDAPPRADAHTGDKTSVGPSVPEQGVPETGTTTTSPDGVTTSTTPTPGSTPDPGTGSGGGTVPGTEDPGPDATNPGATSPSGPGATSPTNPTGNSPGSGDTLRRRR